MKATIKIELEFESWHDADRMPITKEQWQEFFQEHLIEYPKSILGVEPDVIALDSWEVKVLEIKD